MSDQTTIDRYIMGQMSPSEREDFERLLSEDTELREQVELESLMADGILAANLREQMQSLSTESKDENSGGRIVSLNRFRWVGVAASIALLAVIFWQTREGSSIPGFEGVYSADAGLPVAMGEVEDRQFAEAMVAYKDGEYQTAAIAFSNLCESQTIADACFYYAQTLIQNQKWSEARSQLSAINGNVETDLQQKIDWHLAYVLSQLEDETYRSILNDIARDDSHSFQSKAQEVLGE